MPFKPSDERHRIVLAAATRALLLRDRPSRLRITVDGQSYDVMVEPLPDLEAEEAGAEPEVEIPESVLIPPLLPDTREEDKVCRSPLAGAILAVHAEVGRFLRQDDPVAIIEAMKMQTAVGAPVEGLVEEVMVNAGDSVKVGQPLCRLG